MPTKVTFILSQIDKALPYEWIASNINQNEFELSFIILNQKSSYLHNWLLKKGVKSYFINHSGKKSYPKSFLKVVKLLLKLKPNVIHTHLFDANIIGLTAAKFLGIKKRIYSRHHSTYHHQYFPNAIKWDKWSNRIATHIVAISKNVENVLIEKENVQPNKVTLIHYGFDFEKFNTVTPEELNELKDKYQLQNNSPVIGVISRFISWKGIQYIIPAFKELLKQYPNAKLVLANANGPFKTEIQQLLQTELLPQQYTEISFEANMYALYQLFDVFVHVPINKEIEAFGQVYVEALAAGIPSVYTLSGIASEFVKNQTNAIVVNYENSNEILKGILSIIENNELKDKLINNGKQSLTPFELPLFIQKLEKLYA